MDTKTKLKEFLSDEEKPNIDDFYNQLYFRGICLGNEIPFFPVADAEADEAEVLNKNALIEQYGMEEYERITSALLRRRIREEEQIYRWFFKQGVKIGHTVSEIVHEQDEQWMIAYW